MIDSIPKFQSPTDVMKFLAQHGGDRNFLDADEIFEDIHVLSAQDAGYIEANSTGGGWGYTQELRLTDEGRRLMGLPPVPAPSSRISDGLSECWAVVARAITFRRA